MYELVNPTINFAILVAVLAYFLKKPVIEMVRSRHASIKQLAEEAEKLRQESEKKYREFDEKLRSFEAEAGGIVEKARKDAEGLKQKIIENAKESAQRVLRESRATVQAQFDECREEIRREAITRAVDLAEKLIKERLSSDDQKRIVTEYMGKVQ